MAALWFRAGNQGGANRQGGGFPGSWHLSWAASGEYLLQQFLAAHALQTECVDPLVTDKFKENQDKSEERRSWGWEVVHTGMTPGGGLWGG